MAGVVSRRMVADVLRAAMIPLIVGWIIAAFFGALVAKAQYDAIASVFPPDKLAGEYATRIDHLLRQGALLLLPQIGLVAGLLAWLAAKGQNPGRCGLMAGLLLSIIYGTIMLALHIPPLVIVLSIIILTGAGASARFL